MMTNTKTTVAELIEKLKKFDGNLEVLFNTPRGYIDVKGKMYEMVITKDNKFVKGGKNFLVVM